MAQEPNLPSYRQPPLNEVVCGVQYEPLTSFTSVHFGKFWSRVRDMYPKAEDREPLVEVFEGGRGMEAQNTVVFQMPPLRRVFYVDDSGNYLLQLQPSRFLSNWRKLKDDDAYPRFDVAYERFVRGWQEFVGFAKDEQVGPAQVNQYELTYINHIFETNAPFPEAIQDYLGLFSWKNALTLNFLPAPRFANVRLQFALPNGRGTLHVTLNHGKRLADQKGVMVLDLTARGPSRRTDGADMEEWFNAAHETIVKGFTDLTTAEAQTKWERER